MNLGLRLLYNSTLRLNKSRLVCGRYGSTQSNTPNDDIIDITSIDHAPKYEEQLTELETEEIMMKRNKSRLSTGDRNKILDRPPYNNEDLTWFHQTIRYKKRMFGRYGMRGLNIPVGALWPTQEEILDKVEFEKAATPHTVQKGWELINQRNLEQAEGIRLREEDIAKKMAKVEQWKKDFYTKIAKKEANVLAAIEKKERLMEEVRRQFGFKVDTKSAKFKEAIEKKEKEDKKRTKEAKKQERAAKIMEKLLSSGTADNLGKIQSENTEKKEG